MEQNNKLVLFLVLLIICLAIILLPNIYRNKYEQGSLIGEESYFNLRLASNSFARYDELSYGGRELTVERGWPIILSQNPVFLSKWLPSLLGVISFLLFFFLIKDSYISTLIFILSPQFIYAFSTSTKYAIVIPLFLLLLTFRTKDVLASLITSLIFLFDFFAGIIALCVLYYYIKDNKKIIFPVIFGSVLTYFNFFNIDNFSLNTFAYFPAEIKSFIHFIFSDLGSFAGFGIFTFLIAMIGVYFLWRENIKFIGIYILFLILLYISTLFNSLLLLLSIPISILSATTFKEIFDSVWESKLLKQLTIAALFCGVLFSGIAFEGRILSSEPTGIKMQALDFISTLAEKGIVLSSDENGHLITYSGYNSFIDKNYKFIKDLEERKDVSKQIFNSIDSDKLYRLIQKNKINYILIDENMKDFSFSSLLEKDTKFSKIYDNSNIQIWSVVL